MASLTRNGKPLKCLLLGYNGVGNTGADVRVLTSIEDIRDAFGPETQFTVITLNYARTEAILPKDDHIRIAEVSFTPHRFTFAIWRLCKQHDITFLVEGSTFKQNWSIWLLHGYLWASECARLNKNFAIAYAVDVGELHGIHAARAKYDCQRIDLLITRTEIARTRLQKMGIDRTILANTDTAFRHICEPAARTGNRKVVGVAPIEFFHWPVRLRLWSRAEDRYRWPFSFSWNPQRRQQSAEMVERWVSLVKHALVKHDVDIQLIAMEDLDTPVCEKILEKLGPLAEGRVSISSSRKVPPHNMVSLLRGLDALVTSRYHACVLSMGGAVPQMAIGHDERLESIYAEMGIKEDFFLQYLQPDLSDRLIKTFDRLMEQQVESKALIQNKLDNMYMPACRQNSIDLQAWGESIFDSAPPKVVT